MNKNIKLDKDLQFCPLCLREAPYHRLSWMPTAVTVCLEHKCLLVYRCSNCQKNIEMVDILKISCQACKFELTASPVVSVATEEFGLFAQTVIQAWLFNKSLTSSPDERYSLPIQPPNVLYEILRGICRSIVGYRSRWNELYKTSLPVSLNSSITPFIHRKDIPSIDFYLLYTAALRALMDLPEGFFDFLNAYRLWYNPKRAGRTSEDLGPICWQWLRKAYESSEFQFSEQGLNSSNSYFPFIFPSVSIFEAAEILKTSVHRVERFIQVGLLTNYRQRQDNTSNQLSPLV